MTTTIAIILAVGALIVMLTVNYISKKKGRDVSKMGQVSTERESKILLEDGKPVLKQFGDLTSEDFNKYPVWIQCHVIDYDEKWYDDTDEETFRPWIDDLPVSPDYAMFLVKADLVANDGSKHTGFITPCLEEDSKHENELGLIQPQIFTPNGVRVGFWTGMFPMEQHKIDEFYNHMGRNADQVFPITFAATDGFSDGVTSGKINGFLTIPENNNITVSK